MAQASVQHTTLDTYLIVAAIDFGTTHSGYAFSTIKDQQKIHMNKNWGHEFGYASYKCPTSVLTGPNGEFISFGFAAENDYCVKIEDDETNENGYNLYRHFKMMLYRNKMKLSSQVTSTAGHSRDAIDIFVMALRYLKEHLLENLTRAKICTMEDNMIRWVLTVPAIWNDTAKQFMREASFRAGLIDHKESRQLLIALEPEAASMYCRDVNVELLQQESDVQNVHFASGEVYLILDAGGGTVDITAHEIQSKSKVKEVHPPAGAPLGGISVDNNFEVLLKDILGKECIADLKRNSPQAWMDIMLKFEKAKMAFIAESNSDINIHLSYAIGEAYSNYSGKSLDVGINAKQHLGVNFQNGALVINGEKAKELFIPVVDGIVSKVDEILNDSRLQSVGYILLVGGFGQCILLQEAIKRKFQERAIVLIPAEAQLAIIKGAILFGHDPSNITMRIARMTYGIGVSKSFKEDLHDTKYKFLSFGKAKCNHLFRTIIEQNQEIETGKAIRHKLGTTEGSSKEGCSSLSIYNTGKKNVMYDDEEGVEKLGTITVHYPPSNQSETLAVEVIVGGTELHFRAMHTDTKEWMSTTVDFLSD